MDAGASAAVTAAPWDGNLESLAGRVRAGDKRALPALASEFESLFLSQVLKSMRDTAGPEGGLFGQDQADIYGGLFDQFLGKHLAQAGGFGLARVLEKQLNLTADPGKTTPLAPPWDRITQKYRTPA